MNYTRLSAMVLGAAMMYGQYAEAKVPGNNLEERVICEANKKYSSQMYLAGGVRDYRRMKSAVKGYVEDTAVEYCIAHPNQCIKAASTVQKAKKAWKNFWK